MNDTELAVLVQQARKVMQGVTPNRLRKDVRLRDETAKALEAIKASLEPMIEPVRKRAFDFNED